MATEDDKTITVAKSMPASSDTGYEIAAIKPDAFMQWGCPYCGSVWRNNTTSLRQDNVIVLNCLGCWRGFFVITHGQTSKIAVGVGGSLFCSSVNVHPRKGQDTHDDCSGLNEGRTGIGLHVVPGCFVCGGQRSLLRGFMVEVNGKGKANNLLALFGGVGACFEPLTRNAQLLGMDKVRRIRIGACHTHLRNLERLWMFAGTGGLTENMVSEARQEVAEVVC